MNAVVNMVTGLALLIFRKLLLWFTLECGIFRFSLSSARSPSPYSKGTGEVLLTLL